MSHQEPYLPEGPGNTLKIPPVVEAIQETEPEAAQEEEAPALSEDVRFEAGTEERKTSIQENPSDTVETARQVFGPDTDKPFIVNLHLNPTARPGHFVPRASVEIDPSLRTSGLLAALPAEEVKTLLVLLTFLSPNGDVKPTAWEVSQGLHISESKAKERLSRLARFRWQSRPLIATLWRESGMDGYTLSPAAASYRSAPEPAASLQPSYRTAGRDAVLATSRARYARPRVEVERQIAMMQGWPLPEESANGTEVRSPGDGETTSTDYLLQRLLRLGVTAEQAGLLVETFPLEEIEAQIAWLPYRGAKNPASYLVAAITGRYAEPGLLRMKREQMPILAPKDLLDESEAPWQESI